jgi:methionyl aminopeptidase
MPRHRNDKADLKNAKQLDQMRAAGRVVAEVLDLLEEHVRPGVSPAELDRIAEAYLRSKGGTPSFKGYPKYLPREKRFPATLCVAVNDVVVHGIPDETPLEEGDIIAIDVGVILDGWHGDATRTYAVGAIDDESRRLMNVCQEALGIGINTARAGRHLTDISAAIEGHVVANGFQVVRNLFGHGIGRNLHEAPSLPHYGPPGQGPILKPGMVITIEPMIVAGSNEVTVLDDGWTIVTNDGARSAQYEHTVAITDNGPRILTLR